MSTGLLVIPNSGIVNILGQKDGRVGPLKAFYRTSIKPLLPGTLTIVGDLATFSGLDPSTKFKVGQYICIETSPTKKLAYIADVDSTTAKFASPDVDRETGKHLPFSLALNTATQFRPWHLRDLGDLSEEGVKISWDEKVAPTKFAGRGETDANHFSSGSEMKINLSCAEMGLEELVSAIDQSVAPDYDTDGNITSISFTKRLGYNFKKNADSLDLFAYGENGGISTDPRDRARIWLCNFRTAFEQQRNATSQTVITLDGTVYDDINHKKDGKAVFMTINPEAAVFD
ncbi:hypothetical protein ND856_18665 [Leptospira bandrabouensis]|uniref:hypothetical protein n=1 Tax=Leptospira bandrabouensis TaxID=2484903 RepID=UPI00223CA08A|nr:hypothetical protein [Leptospira bandrabouensis]MCW7460153.1 hypothetical protein [Leptospira bandrabouensis]MCW7479330.1 hypothetical protein [Leptospira bandrabouensis]MCW7487012.1 hypothetical protein [Leptospira bandrabouensis]